MGQKKDTLLLSPKTAHNFDQLSIYEADQQSERGADFYHYDEDQYEDFELNGLDTNVNTVNMQANTGASSAGGFFF
jgi:hypothetical protein